MHGEIEKGRLRKALGKGWMHRQGLGRKTYRGHATRRGCERQGAVPPGGRNFKEP